MPPCPRTPVTSYSPRTTSPTLHSVSIAGGDGTASAIVGRGAAAGGAAAGAAGTGRASSCVGAGPAGRAAASAIAGPGARKEAWHRPQRTVRPATVAGALALAPHAGHVMRRGGPGGETAIRGP